MSLRPVMGVDGCRIGWVAVVLDDRQAVPEVVVAPGFADLLAHPADPEIMAVDMPIGLPARIKGPGRAAEQAVRPHLGARQSSVFSVPSRSAVWAKDYAEACGEALATSDPPRKVSKQCFMLFPRIREIDRLMTETPALEERIYEVHPELVFWRLNGRCPMALPKKVKSRANGPGLAERIALLSRHGIPGTLFDAARPSGVGLDDLVDAAANAVMATRIRQGLAEPFPADPPRDAKGLRIAIWA